MVYQMQTDCLNTLRLAPSYNMKTRTHLAKYIIIGTSHENEYF